MNIDVLMSVYQAYLKCLITHGEGVKKLTKEGGQGVNGRHKYEILVVI